MKRTDFANYLSKFFTEYMPGIHGNAATTIDSYRYSFIHLLIFIKEKYCIDADRMQISDLTYERITSFYKWLENERRNSAATRNQRQAAINSFVHFLIYEYPDYLKEYQRILGIPLKKSEHKEISYAKAEEMKTFFDHVNTQTKQGLRDYVLLSLLYSTGIRVSELINIRVKDISTQEPATILIHGKGNKGRYVPLVKNIIPIVQKYLAQNHLDRPEKYCEWLFKNHMNQQFRRQGINYLVNKYKKLTNKEFPDTIPSDFSPHKIRHSTAMGLVESDVDLMYIRDLLDHSSITSTEIYAKADSKKKRDAIEAASKEIVPHEEAEWENDMNLQDWLKGFGR